MSSLLFDDAQNLSSSTVGVESNNIFTNSTGSMFVEQQDLSDSLMRLSRYKLNTTSI